MRGVAATMASVIVFASLIVSNLVVYYSESQSLSMASKTTLEREEAALGELVVSQSAYAALGGIEHHLEQYPPRCESWEEYATSLLASSTLTGAVGPMHYSVTSSAAVAKTGGADDLAMLGLFDGYDSGSLNLEVRAHLNVSASGPPTLVVDESHTIHLPIALSSSLSLCRSLIIDLARSVSPCGGPSSASRLDEVAQRYTRLAASSGLSLALSRWFVRAGGCWVLFYAFTLSQDSVPGVVGSFGWHLSGSGSA